MYTYKAEVIRVIDGDTIRLRVDLGFYMTYESNFRIYGIDAPEITGVERPEGLLSKQYVNSLLPVGSIHQIQTFKADKYGRWLADILIESEFGKGIMLSELLLSEGFAKRYE